MATKAIRTSRGGRKPRRLATAAMEVARPEPPPTVIAGKEVTSARRDEREATRSTTLQASADTKSNKTDSELLCNTCSTLMMAAMGMMMTSVRKLPPSHPFNYLEYFSNNSSDDGNNHNSNSKRNNNKFTKCRSKCSGYKR